MAKYASALVQLGFSLDRIGFIFRFYLEAAPFVLRTLLKDELDLFDDELGNLAIGCEFDFQRKNLAPRDVIIRTDKALISKTDENELLASRYIFCRFINATRIDFSYLRLAFSLYSTSLQHILIASERDYSEAGIPGPELDKLRIIKEASFVISPDELVGQVNLAIN